MSDKTVNQCEVCGRMYVGEDASPYRCSPACAAAIPEAGQYDMALRFNNRPRKRPAEMTSLADVIDAMIALGDAAKRVRYGG